MLLLFGGWVADSVDPDKTPYSDLGWNSAHACLSKYLE